MTGTFTPELTFGQYAYGTYSDPAEQQLYKTLRLDTEFSPLSLFSGGAAGGYYDPSDSTTVFQDSAGTTPAAVNDPVGRLEDKSGNGNHLVQATAASRPILRQSGDLYYLEFDGVDDELAVTSTPTWDDMLALVAGNLTSNVLFYVDTTTGNASQLLWVSLPGIRLFAGNGAVHTVAGPVGATDAVAGANIEAATNGGTAYVDGVAEALSTGGASTGGFKRIVIAGGSRFYAGVFLGRLGSSSDIASTNTWLGAKAGLTL